MLPPRLADESAEKNHAKPFGVVKKNDAFFCGIEKRGCKNSTDKSSSFYLKFLGGGRNFFV